MILAFALYNSRGQYRLRDEILNVPGHPPVPLDAITSIDKTYWDRKGIVFINYELPNGKAGKVRLDDFIYQRPPTDEIYKRIEAYTGTAEMPADSPASQTVRNTSAPCPHGPRIRSLRLDVHSARVGMPKMRSTWIGWFHDDLFVIALHRSYPG